MNTVYYGSGSMNHSTQGAQAQGPMAWAPAAVAPVGIGQAAAHPQATLPYLPAVMESPVEPAPAKKAGRTISTRPPAAVACMLMAAFAMLVVSGGMAFGALIEVL